MRLLFVIAWVMLTPSWAWGQATTYPLKGVSDASTGNSTTIADANTETNEVIHGGDDMVVVSGNVPDTTTKMVVLQKLKAIYGTDKVVDHLSVGGVVSPAKWGQYVTAMITPDLKKVSKGRIEVKGNIIDVQGQLTSQADKDAVLSSLSHAFSSRYSIQPSLQVVKSKQEALDDTLANRTIQFRSGSAVLTRAGQEVLNQMAQAIKKLNNPFIQIIGNTDNVGRRMSNIRLSLARARAVKQYLIGKGIPARNLSVSGQGPDNPIASNDTAEGRSRNRRIDFRISK